MSKAAPIDTHSEHVVTMAEATRYAPLRKNGKRPCPRTLKRWADEGRVAENGERVYLGKVRMPSGPCTSHEAIDRFLAALQAADRAAPVARIDPAQERAERYLHDMGFADDIGVMAGVQQ